MSEEKNTIKEILDYLPDKTTLAKQGLSLDNVDVKQLHISCEQTSNPENLDIQDFFFLVTKVENKTCHVIPGSFDGVMAGPNDIVLPKNILGQYVYLSLDMQEIVPISSLDKGFAILDDQSFDKVIQAIDAYNQDDKAIKTSFANGMPYISKHDDRIEYHEHQKALLTKRELIKIASYPPLIASCKLNIFNVRKLCKVASFLIVGTLVTYFLLHEMSLSRRVAKSTPIELEQKEYVTQSFPQAPKTILRGNKQNLLIYSPQEIISTKEPKIMIGGDRDKEYVVVVSDMDGSIIGEKKILGQSTITWKNFSTKTLVEEEFYTLTVKSSFEDKFISRTSFWILESKKAEELQHKINMLGKDFNNEVRQISKEFAKGRKDILYKKALLLYQYNCYSEAYIEIIELLKEDPKNKNYQKLKADCCERLNLK